MDPQLLPFLYSSKPLRNAKTLVWLLSSQPLIPLHIKLILHKMLLISLSHGLPIATSMYYPHNFIAQEWKDLQNLLKPTIVKQPDVLGSSIKTLKPYLLHPSWHTAITQQLNNISLQITTSKAVVSSNGLKKLLNMMNNIGLKLKVLLIIGFNDIKFICLNQIKNVFFNKNKYII